MLFFGWKNMRCHRSSIAVTIPNAAFLDMELSFEFFPIHEQRALCRRENGDLVEADNDAYEARAFAKSSAYFFAFSSSPSFRYISYTFLPST
jgi:hypothetical protein